jgi:hypothetical protein
VVVVVVEKNVKKNITPYLQLAVTFKVFELQSWYTAQNEANC